MKFMSVVALVLASIWVGRADVTEMSYGKWTIVFDDATMKSSFIKEGDTILRDVSVRFKVESTLIDASTYDKAVISNTTHVDAVGEARKYIIEYSDTRMAANPVVRQAFYLYPDRDYFLTEVMLVAASGEVKSNYIAPVYSEAQNLFLPQDANNRFLTIPFDNDGFVTYGSFPLSRTNTVTSHSIGRIARDSISFEVTSVFNGETQQGLVIGSVEHDNWKSAVRLTGSPLTQSYLSRLECFSGVTHSATRDAVGDYLQPHGSLSGAEVKSARMLVGYFSDWRTGMETYGEVNNLIAPKRTWNKPTPFGWNSWGGMERNVNYDGVISVSDFIKENLQDKGHYAQDGLVFVGLDSFWDNLNWDQLKSFADHCKANGQVPGIYWTPFCDWYHASGDAVEGNNGYHYWQTRLYVNGEERSLCGAKCMDPTSPATLSRINYFVDRFKDLGFRYIKLDFQTNGIVEADSYYNKDITTGVQAYNYGMKHLRERCGDDIFLVESISPLFPAQYAHARRISCDAWGEMWHTNYMMNSFSFGWWLDRVYCYNDPDHIVMGNRSDAENISRMTTAAVTGYCMLGDNLATAGSYIGDETSQTKAVKYATYERINDVINLGRSFRPAYGHKLSGSNNSVDLFYLETDEAYYIAHFNYGIGDKTGTIDLATMGIDASAIDMAESYECWSSAPVTITDGQLKYSSPHNQAKLYYLSKKQ
ncbi:MAG: hypothetical protein IJY36_08785 [Coprobacter sp.]|nr:hypothetical protein [Coprobacter sp.]